MEKLIDKIINKLKPPFTYEERVLEHGYVRVIDSWGSDRAIIEDARMSTAKGFQGWGRDGNVGDEKLLKYLYEHKHMTPFEGSGFKIEVCAPIMVFREWQRHRTQSYNEMSARYTPLASMDYLPTVERCIVVPGANKQANGSKVPTHTDVLNWLRALEVLYAHAEVVYQGGLMLGIPKELARLPVPVARYSKMRATANLRNWIGFLTLREDEAAQWEIRQYAHVVSRIVQERFPRTHELYLSSLSK